MAIETKDNLTVQSPDVESGKVDRSVSGAHIEKVKTNPRKKWLLLAAAVLVAVIIVLAIVLPITLTRKTTSPTSPTPAPTFITLPEPADIIPSGINLSSASPITWRQAGQTLRGFESCNNVTSCAALALSSDGQVLIASVPIVNNSTTNETVDKEALLTHIQAYSLDNVTNLWVAKGSPISLQDYNSTRPAVRVAISSDGSVVAISRPGISVGVFRFDNFTNMWSQMGPDMVGPDGLKNAFGIRVKNAFGTSVAMSLDGSIVAVGDTVYNEVTAFRFNGAGWVQLGQTLYGGGFYSSDRFGSSVALSDNGGVLAVLASKAEGDAYMQIFTLKPHGWEELFYTRTGYDISEHESAKSLALSGDGMTAAVGLQIYLGSVLTVQVFTFGNDSFISNYRYNNVNWNYVDIDIAVDSSDFPVNLALSSDGSVLAATTSQRVTVFGYNATAVGWDNITSFSVNTTKNTYFSMALSKDATTIATAYTQGKSFTPAIQVVRAHQEA